MTEGTAVTGKKRKLITYTKANKTRKISSQEHEHLSQLEDDDTKDREEDAAEDREEHDADKDKMNNRGGEDTDYARTSNNIIAGLDFGTAFSAIVVTNKQGEQIRIGRYPGAPPSFAGRSDEIYEVPSIVTLRKGNPPTFEFGYEATSGTQYRLTNIKALIAGEPRQSARLTKLLERFSRGLRQKVTKELLLQRYLEYLRQHLVQQCSAGGQEVPTIVVATHPVAWSSSAIMMYRRLLEKAGWGRVETITEPEAAADVVLRGQPDTFFSESGTNICVVDLGGMTHDRAFYRVRKVKGRIIKEELIKSVGGYGGMALMDDLARSVIEYEDGLKDSDVDYLCQVFSLERMRYTSGDLTGGAGSLRLHLAESEMLGLYEICLKPIVTTTERFRQTLRDHEIETVFLVGGTSSSMWLRPHLIEAFGNEVKLIFPLDPVSTLIATGATLAWSPNALTATRFSSLHLGHLVTRQYCGSFHDSSIWGEPKQDESNEKVVEVVELIKMKASGEKLFSPSFATWHWVELSDDILRDPEEILLNTYVYAFASEIDDLSIVSDPDYFDVAPEGQFQFAIEQRHVFNSVDIEKLEVTIKQRLSQASHKKASQPAFAYALRFVNDGLGLRLHVAWTKDLQRVKSTEKSLHIKDLGQVKFVVNAGSQR